MTGIPPLPRSTGRCSAGRAQGEHEDEPDGRLDCVMPVPVDAPAPPASLKGLGAPRRRETYHDAAGR